MLDDDGLPLDEVGPWARDKHERLRQYVAIAAGARATFIAAGGGASYVDLFCGSGRAVIRDSKERIDGSPLVAFRAARAGRVPFSEIHLGDIDPYGCAAAAARIANAGGAAMHYAGKAEDTVAPIVGRLDPRGLHFAFLDPFRLDDLPFSVLVTLAGLPHIDLLIHLNAQDLQRSLDDAAASGEGPLDRFAPGWRNAVDLRQAQPAQQAFFMAHWATLLESLGLPPARRTEVMAGTAANRRPYWLVLISGNAFAQELWERMRNVAGTGTV